MSTNEAFDLGYDDAYFKREEKTFSDDSLAWWYRYGYWNGQNVRREYANSDMND